MKNFQEFQQSINEARADYKRNRSGPYNTKVTVCYISPITRMRACDDLWFKSKLDALGFKDDVRGFPKGAEVEAIKVMKESADHEESILEKLSVSDGMDAWISDFHKSDAPQFKGKSKEERTKMAIAAFKSAEGTNEETGTSAVAGAGDDSSTVVVKKKKRRTLDDVLTR